MWTPPTRRESSQYADESLPIPSLIFRKKDVSDLRVIHEAEIHLGQPSRAPYMLLVLKKPGERFNADYQIHFDEDLPQMPCPYRLNTRKPEKVRIDTRGRKVGPEERAAILKMAAEVMWHAQKTNEHQELKPLTIALLHATHKALADAGQTTIELSKEMKESLEQ
jgi:hypothetical protein